MTPNDSPGRRSAFAAAQAEIDQAYAEELRTVTLGGLVAVQRQAAELADDTAALLEHPSAVFGCLFGMPGAGLAADLRAAHRAVRQLADNIRRAWLSKPGAIWDDPPRRARGRFVELQVPAEIPRAFGDEPPDPAA